VEKVAERKQALRVVFSMRKVRLAWLRVSFILLSTEFFFKAITDGVIADGVKTFRLLPRLL